jgi:phospholipid/cholesterol/gamma-HCH transport system substrate-binding protein
MRTATRARWARFRVTVTALVSLTILFTLVYLLTGGGLFKSQSRLRSYFEDSGGLERGAIVRLQGVRIGKVSAVGLSGLNDPQRTVEVVMSIERRYLAQIPSDSKSEISTDNALGDKHIEINPGKSATPVKENAQLAHKPATNVYVRIDLTTFTAQLRGIDAVLKDIQEGKGGIGQFVMTDKLYRDLISGVKQVGRQVESAVSPENTVGELLYSRESYENLRGSLQRLDAGLAQLQAGRGPTGRLLRDAAAYAELRAKLADLDRQVNQIRDTELLKSDALYQTWNRNVSALIRAVDNFSAGPLLNDVQLYESLLGATLELTGSVKDLRENPKRYLRMRMKIF